MCVWGGGAGQVHCLYFVVCVSAAAEQEAGGSWPLVINRLEIGI